MTMSDTFLESASRADGRRQTPARSDPSRHDDSRRGRIAADAARVAGGFRAVAPQRLGGEGVGGEMAGKGLVAQGVGRLAGAGLQQRQVRLGKAEPAGNQSQGRLLGVFLPRGTAVRGGDVLVAEDGSLIQVKAAPQAVLKITHCSQHGVKSPPHSLVGDRSLVSQSIL